MTIRGKAFIAGAYEHPLREIADRSLAKIHAAVATGAPENAFEGLYGPNVLGMYALAARRHMYEFGTTSEQLAWIKVAASRHAKHNPNAMLPYEVTVDDVLSSPMVADPLHRLDSCV